MWWWEFRHQDVWVDSRPGVPQKSRTYYSSAAEAVAAFDNAFARDHLGFVYRLMCRTTAGTTAIAWLVRSTYDGPFEVRYC